MRIEDTILTIQHKRTTCLRFFEMEKTLNWVLKNELIAKTESTIFRQTLTRIALPIGWNMQKAKGTRYIKAYIYYIYITQLRWQLQEIRTIHLQREIEQMGKTAMEVTMWKGKPSGNLTIGRTEIKWEDYMKYLGFYRNQVWKKHIDIGRKRKRRFNHINALMAWRNKEEDLRSIDKANDNICSNRMSTTSGLYKRLRKTTYAPWGTNN